MQHFSQNPTNLQLQSQPHHAPQSQPMPYSAPQAPPPAPPPAQYQPPYRRNKDNELSTEVTNLEQSLTNLGQWGK